MSSGVAVVLFTSKWSERSRQIIPAVEQLCKNNPTVNFLKVKMWRILCMSNLSFCCDLLIRIYIFGAFVQVDVQANEYLAKSESVEFVPTFKIYKNGYKVKELQGPSLETLEHVVSHFSH